MKQIVCEVCLNRLEDCECEPGFPYGIFDPDDIYGERKNVKGSRKGKEVKIGEKIGKPMGRQ